MASSLMLNLGLRYDYYGVLKVPPTTPVAEIVNFERATDLRKLDFGPPRDPLEPYDPDGINFGPRVGFRVDAGRRARRRSSAAASAICSARTCWRRSGRAWRTRSSPSASVYNRTELRRETQVAVLHRRLPGMSRWPMPAAGRSHLLGLRPETAGSVHDSVDDQRAAVAGPTMAAEVGYIGPMATICRCSGSSAGVRPADRRAAQPVARRARRLLRRQQPDDGLQRAADLVAESASPTAIPGT